MSELRGQGGTVSCLFASESPPIRQIGRFACRLNVANTCLARAESKVIYGRSRRA